MFSKRKTFNAKRSIESEPSKSSLDALVNAVRYGGNPEHKKNPGDFKLKPPANPRPDKTLCDLINIFKREQALELLKEGVRRGLVSKQIRSGYPQNIWAVSDDGCPLEAQLENPGNGTYHGYPIPEGDAFRLKVIEKWND